jgi:hypothetical protein
MALNRKFTITEFSGKFQVRQYGGFSTIYQNRGKPHNTYEEAEADIAARIKAMGTKRSDNRAWHHGI